MLDEVLLVGGLELLLVALMILLGWRVIVLLLDWLRTTFMTLHLIILGLALLEVRLCRRTVWVSESIVHGRKVRLVETVVRVRSVWRRLRLVKWE